ncbi:helix-turn-helix domain-containing protein [Salinisphaera orenii]|uniref:helix-turn-helix domain-containing protein n=1 Tax=Salinisphaera orenii TaxID=856731 RepID=UPI000DBE62B7
MIRVMLKQKLDDKEFRERRRITLNDVSQATGISRPTLTRIANTPGYNTNTDAINALCKYFECLPGDLLQYVDDDDD